MLQTKKSIKEIALVLERSQRTIHREKKRGWMEHLGYDLNPKWVYNADYAQDRADENGTAKRPCEKIGNNHYELRLIALVLKRKKWSPDALVMDFDKNRWPPLCSRICTKTLYTYIYLGYLDEYGFSVRDLPGKGFRHIAKKKR